MRNFPLLLIPFAIYTSLRPSLDLNARVVWVLSIEHILTSLAVIFIGVGVWRSAIFSPRELVHQMVHLALFVVALVELALVGWCHSGTFVILTLATLVTLVDANFVSFVTNGTYVRIVKSSTDANLELKANLPKDGVMERASN
jgi:hypothetical protein